MTLTSFNSPKPCCHELFHNPHDAPVQVSSWDLASRELLGASTEHVVEARRMKAFAGQCKFKAPVADDFSRGMLADGQGPASNALKHTGLLNGLTTWWRRQKLD
jgi:hypothetical protein